MLAAGDRTVKKKLFENCHDAYIWRSGIGTQKQDVGMNLRSHSLDKLGQIITTGAPLGKEPESSSSAAGSSRQQPAAGSSSQQASWLAGIHVAWQQGRRRPRCLPRSLLSIMIENASDAYAAYAAAGADAEGVSDDDGSATTGAVVVGRLRSVGRTAQGVASAAVSELGQQIQAHAQAFGGGSGSADNETAVAVTAAARASWLEEVLPSLVGGGGPDHRGGHGDGGGGGGGCLSPAKRRKLARRLLARGGIPADLRPAIWLSSAGNRLGLTRQGFEAELAACRGAQPTPEGGTADDALVAGRRMIESDLTRTFSSVGGGVGRFAGGTWKDALRQVLEAYLHFRPAPGYVQGMSFLAGMLLLHTDAGGGDAEAAAEAAEGPGAAVATASQPGTIEPQLDATADGPEPDPTLSRHSRTLSASFGSADTFRVLPVRRPLRPFWRPCCLEIYLCNVCSC
jgi:hypothetical protein